MLRLGESGDQLEVNDGTFSVLDGFSMYLAGVVVFRVFFGLLYVLKWQCRYCCNKKYKVTEYNLEQQFKKLKKNRENAESTDDRDDREHLITVAHERTMDLKKSSRRLV